MTVDVRTLRESLSDPRALVEALGLADGHRSIVRHGSGVLVRCPWHADRTPSCSVRVGGDGTIAVRCHACGACGDVLSLIAATNGLDVRRDFREVLRIGAEIAGRWDLLDERATSPVPRPKPIPSPRPEPERDYPPAAEVDAVWSASGRATGDTEARTMLEGRGLDVEHIDALGLARVVPASVSLSPWASFRRQPWTATGHRLVLPVVDHHGDVRSLRAWRIVDGESPKRLPPAGYRASGLVLACPFARAMLAGNLEGLPMPLRIVVVEGEPDFLTWATRFSDADESAPVVLGVLSGSWTSELASRIPDGARIVIRTHADAAGLRYATQVARTLSGRCSVLRPTASTEERMAA